MEDIMSKKKYREVLGRCICKRLNIGNRTMKILEQLNIGTIKYWETAQNAKYLIK